jgi:hypothetical protein
MASIGIAARTEAFVRRQEEGPRDRLCNKSLLKSSKDARQTFVWWAFVFGGVDGPP